MCIYCYSLFIFCVLLFCKALLEKELGPAKKKLSQIEIVLDEKYEKRRILEVSLSIFIHIHIVKK